VPQSGYERIASEYYDSRHKTSRNFDAVTRKALSGRGLIPADGLLLELGRGRSTEFLGVTASRIIQLDSSAAMLDLSDREPCLLKINADACSIPLVSRQFHAVTGFLVDPFFGLDSLAEAFRMLVDGGRLVLTMPTRVWGERLRKRLNIDVMTTRFKIIDREENVILPSLLHSADRIKEMLCMTGFRPASITNEYLPSEEVDISEDITSVCQEMGLGPFDLPLVHVIKAER
jgi:hypothetical protein